MREGASFKFSLVIPAQAGVSYVVTNSWIAASLRYAPFLAKTIRFINVDIAFLESVW